LNAGNGALSILLNTTLRAPLQIVDVGVTKNVLWPPNHKLVDVNVDYNTTNSCLTSGGEAGANDVQTSLLFIIPVFNFTLKLGMTLGPGQYRER
jgi:hypothetical protein